VARRHDGHLVLQAVGLAVVQVHAAQVAPGAVAALYQRGAVEGAQARHDDLAQEGGVVQPQRPAFVNALEDGRRPFDDGDLVVGVHGGNHTMKWAKQRAGG